MFGKLGEMKQMYDKYKKLQEALKNIIIRAKDHTENPIVVIEISGEMKVRNIEIVDENFLQPWNKAALEKAIKVAFEKGQQKAQEVAAEKTKEILGFDPNDLAGMMWGGGGIPGLTG